MRRRFVLFGGAGLLLLGLVAGLLGLQFTKNRLEESLGQLLGSPVSIRSVSISPWHLTLHEVSLRSDSSKSSSTSAGSAPAFSGSASTSSGSGLASGVPFKLERLQVRWGSRMLESLTITGLTLSLGPAPLKAKGHLYLRTAKHAPGQWEGEFTLKHPLLTGWVEVQGGFAEPILFGWLEFPKGARRHFIARLRVSPDSVELVDSRLQEDFRASGRLSLKTPQGEAVLRVGRDGEPPEEFTARFTVQGSQVESTASLFNDRVLLTATTGLPRTSDLKLFLEFQGLPTEELYRWVLPDSPPPVFSGQIHGKVALDGPWSRLKSEGELVSLHGTFGREEYTQAALRFRGVGPILTIFDSQINKPSGALWMEGTVDLRRIGRPDFFSRVRLSSLGKSLAVSGWQMGPLTGGRPGTQTTSGVQIQRMPTSDGVSVNLAYEVDEELAHEPVTREKIEVGVPISEKERLRLGLDKDQQFLGVEHKEKF